MGRRLSSRGSLSSSERLEIVIDFDYELLDQFVRRNFGRHCSQGKSASNNRANSWQTLKFAHNPSVLGAAEEIWFRVCSVITLGYHLVYYLCYARYASFENPSHLSNDTGESINIARLIDSLTPLSRRIRSMNITNGPYFLPLLRM